MNALISRHDCFCSIAVMAVKIPDTNPFSAVFQCVESSNGNVAEVTETHRALPCGVMARRPHQTEGRFATHRGARCLNCRAGRVSRIGVDVRVKWRVCIEVSSGIRDVFKVLTRMRAQQFMICRSARLLPSPVTVPLLQYRRGASNALRTLWMPCLPIFEATWIVKNGHCKLPIQRIFDYGNAKRP